MNCLYCGNDKFNDGYCGGCGAKQPEKKSLNDYWKSVPFFYNGYICYAIREAARDTYEIQFWLGRELIERIELSYQFLREQVKEYEDPLPFFWNLFLVAHGEQEVYEFKSKNDKYPARFLVTRIVEEEKSDLYYKNVLEFSTK